MYYYIMETPRGKTVAWQEKVKDILGNLGIAGETVSPSSARTIEELASLGVVKGYSTIVAVGSESLVNKVVTALINQEEAKNVVLGVIPSDFDSLIAKKIGVKDLVDACQTLKFRKLTTTDACFIEPNKYFLTEATFENNFHAADVYLTFDNIKAGMPVNRLVIRPGLSISIEDYTTQGQPAKKFFNWLLGRKDTTDIFSSFFKTKQLKIESPSSTLPIKVGDEIIAKTPCVCHNASKVLKIIQARDILTNERSNTRGE